MSDNKTVTVTVEDFGSMHDEDTITVADLAAAIAKIPQEHHSTAVMYFNVYGDYASANVEIHYKRPETDGERQKRERDQREQAAADQKARREREYAAYLELKARFEP